jgi:hypothetical protein
VLDGLASGRLEADHRETFEKIVDAQEQRANRKDRPAIHADATRPEGERHRCADTVTFKTTNAALPLVDRARTTIETAINALRMKTKGTAVDGSVKGNMQYAEIRSTLASMTGKDRMSAITKSLEENDDSLVAAALDASRFSQI